MQHIFAVSDGTGRTALQFLNACLTQFSDIAVEIELRVEVRTEAQVHQVILEALDAGGFIIHTLVSDELRRAMRHAGRLNNVETIDLLGPVLARLSEQFADSPSEKPGLFRKLNEEYFRRIESMEYAFRHDDGQRVHELPDAEIVLIGVSRTFKTPMSIYLAFKGWHVANVPIILGLEPSPILFELPPERVFCLTMAPQRLSSLRLVRHERFGGATGDYADYDYVRREVIHAVNIFARQPRWQKIDVTNKPIEEIASEILAFIRQRQEPSLFDPMDQETGS